MPKPLTTKQKAFAEFFLNCWNVSEAAKRAGYANPYNNGHRLMEYDGIKAYIAARLSELKMSADEVLTRLSDQARASMEDFIDVSVPGEGIDGAADMDQARAIVGGWRLNLVKAERNGKLHLVKKVKSGQWGPEIELHDAQAALQLLGRHHKLFVDRTELTGKDGEPIAIDDARGRLAALLERRAALAQAERDPSPDSGAEPG